jgi:molybdopterin-guanine dinucleotide biosynthesis protein A
VGGTKEQLGRRYLHSQSRLYHQGMEAVTAFILAGGKSTRMGSDKAFLELSGRPLLVHAIVIARSVVEFVKVVGAPAKFDRFGPVIPDIYCDHGPLAGIHAALASTETAWNLILAVDQPFLTPAFLRYLISVARSSEATVTVPRTGEYLHPLCAIYRKQFGALAEEALKAGRNKIDELFPDVSLRVIDEAELSRAQFSTVIFRNVNTPEDWDEVRKQFAPVKEVP